MGVWLLEAIRPVYVDYPTLERVSKDSFFWYRDVIAGRRDATRTEEAA
jgi:beta-glucosidase/6-phospho-beta-glucosidase/beta-galactosidase